MAEAYIPGLENFGVTYVAEGDAAALAAAEALAVAEAPAALPLAQNLPENLVMPPVLLHAVDPVLPAPVLNIGAPSLLPVRTVAATAAAAVASDGAASGSDGPRLAPCPPLGTSAVPAAFQLPAAPTVRTALLPRDFSAEVIPISIPVPKLNIPFDAKFDPRAAADRTRAFVRDVRKYLTMVKGGHVDEVRCLFLATALEGRAKTWHDEWTLARGTYTSEDLLHALLTRFAPQMQPLEMEARQKLISGLYRMRVKETVAAFQSRFEALLTNIPTATDQERFFWFWQGLSEELFAQTATDDRGVAPQTYAELIALALGRETAAFSAKQARSALRFNFVSPQAADGEGVLPPSKRQKGQSGLQVAAVAAAAASDGFTTQRRKGGRGGRGGASRSGGRGDGAGPSDPNKVMTKFGITVAEMLRRQQAKLCYCCGEKHHIRDCAVWAAKKAQ